MDFTVDIMERRHVMQTTTKWMAGEGTHAKEHNVSVSPSLHIERGRNTSIDAPNEPLRNPADICVCDDLSSVVSGGSTVV